MTITTNIHFGLAAWTQNHAYSVLGARISNGGNAYQVITTGTSQNTPGAGPTGTTSNITDGTVHWKWLSAIDFTTLQGWSNSIANPLADNYTGLIWNDAPITTTSGTTILNHTGHVPAGFFMTLKCAPGESHRDATGAVAINTANGVSVVLPATGTGSTNYFIIQNANTTIDGIQIQDPNSGSNSTIMQINQPAITIQNCIFDGFAQAGGASLLDIETGCSSFDILNCLFIDRRSGFAGDCVATGSALSGSVTASVVNCTFVSINANTLAYAFTALNTNAAGINVTNCSFFGWTNPVQNTSTSGAVAADHCVTDATAFPGNVTNGTGNLFGKTASNQFVSATTDFRLSGLSGCDCVDAGRTDTTDLPSADDIRKQSRPKGVSWDVGMFEYGSTTTKALSLSGAQIPVAFKGVGKPYAALSAEVASSGSPVKAGLHNKALTLAETQAASVHRIRGLDNMLAVQAQTSHFATQLFRVCVVAAKSPQNFKIVRFLSKALAVISPQSIGMIRALSGMPLSVISQATQALVNTINKVLNVTPSGPSETYDPFTQQFTLDFGGSYIASMVSTVTKQLGHTSNFSQRQAFSIVKVVAHLTSLSLFQVNAATKQAAIAVKKSLAVASSSVVFALPRLVLRNVKAATNTQTASSFQGRLKSQATSSVQGYAASIVRGVFSAFHVTDPQSVGAAKGVGHPLSLSDGQVASTNKSPALLRATVSPASQGLQRAPGRARGTSSPQGLSITRAISTRLAGGVTTQVAAMTRFRILSKGLQAANAQASVVLRGITHGAQAASGAALGVARGISKMLAAAMAQVVAIGAGLGATRPQAAHAISQEIAGVARGAGRVLSSSDAQVASSKGNRGLALVVASGEGVFVLRRVNVIRSALSAEAAAAAKQRRSVLQSTDPQLAHSLASRAVNVGVAQRAVAFLVKWYHLFVPESDTQNRVFLPPADGPPEPPYFSAIDPADQSVFLFDWSARAQQGDAIASAQVVSVPTGLNFVGPLFIENMVVEITLGPFSPPELPTQYGLRCTVTFVSGERSSFTIPVPVRTL